VTALCQQEKIFYEFAEKELNLELNRIKQSIHGF